MRTWQKQKPEAAPRFSVSCRSSEAISRRSPPGPTPRPRDSSPSTISFLEPVARREQASQLAGTGLPPRPPPPPPPPPPPGGRPPPPSRHALPPSTAPAGGTVSLVTGRGSALVAAACLCTAW